MFKYLAHFSHNFLAKDFVENKAILENCKNFLENSPIVFSNIVCLPSLIDFVHYLSGVICICSDARKNRKHYRDRWVDCHCVRDFIYFWRNKSGNVIKSYANIKISYLYEYLGSHHLKHFCNSHFLNFC